MFLLSRIIIRSYKEQVQGYLSISCTLGSQALTKGGVIIITVHSIYMMKGCVLTDILYLYILDKGPGVS
jgi:hypothetical protein